MDLFMCKCVHMYMCECMHVYMLVLVHACVYACVCVDSMPCSVWRFAGYFERTYVIVCMLSSDVVC